MPLKDLYELIRKDDVCIFIGSGFSMYAGYPSVGQVKELLYQSLNYAEKNQLDIEVPLRDFCSNFETLRSRSEMIHILQAAFKAPKTEAYYHQLLSKIAHFKTIITTNYDTLLEDAYTKKAVTIRSSQDIPVWKNKLIKIYKIHGDINHPDSIILTRADYSRFYNPTNKDLFWSAVRNEIATKHILFLGYGYEDENIWAEFDNIFQQTGTNRKKRYLVGRAMSPLKHRQLEQQQIEFIEANYEQFVPELVENLKLHLPADLRSGQLSIDTAREFISSFDLDYKIEDYSGKAQLLTVNKKGAPFIANIKLTTEDQSAAGLMTKLLNNEILNVTLDASQLGDFSLTSEGFGLMNRQDIGKLELMSIPILESRCSLEFPEQDFELEHGNFKLYGSPKNYTITGELRNFSIEVKAGKHHGKNGIKFHITEPVGPSSLKDLIDIFQALVYMMDQQKMNIHLENGTVIKQQLARLPELKQSQMRLQIFKGMKKIERFFKIRFPKFKIHDLKNDDLTLIRKIESLIDNGYYAVGQKETSLFDLPIDDELMNIMKDMPKDAEMYWQSIGVFTPEILGIKLPCGKQQLTMINAELLRIEDESRTAVFKLQNDIAVYHYERFGFKKSPNTKTLWSSKDSPDETDSSNEPDNNLNSGQEP